MRFKLLAVGLMLATLPATAMAQPDPGCVQQNQQNRAAGTILGAVGGALLGGALAGRHSTGAGVVLGGVGGAVAGNAIAGANNHPCPAGYYYAPPPGPEGPPPGGGFWASAPRGIHDRIDFMQDRINRAANRGSISPREFHGAMDDLNFTRNEEARLRNQNYGHLRPEDRAYLQSRLNSIAARLHWSEHYG